MMILRLFLFINCLLFVGATALAQPVTIVDPPALAPYQVGKVYFKLADEVRHFPRTDGRTTGIAELDAALAPYPNRRLTQPFVKLGTDWMKRAYRIEALPAGAESELVKVLAGLKIVEFAERVPQYYGQQAVPNDPRYDECFQLEEINAPTAFAFYRGGATIAIVDDAVLTDHEDLAANSITGFDVADGDSDARPPRVGVGDDGAPASPEHFSHGTHVAGIAGSVTNNGVGIASPGWNNTILPVKCTPDDVPLGDRSIPFSMDGVAYAATRSADVINMSFGGYAYSEMDYQVIETARASGAMLVAAAGNDGTTLPFYPAAYGEGTTGEAWEVFDRQLVVAVASVDPGGTRSLWGGFGPITVGSQYGSWVDISAYGNGILSSVAGTVEENGEMAYVTDQYAMNTGTSMAAPLVAGALGYLRSFRPDLPTEDILSCLIGAANDDIYDNEENLPGTLGSGRLDLAAAQACLGQDCTIGAVAGVVASANNICAGGTVTLTANGAQSYLWSTGETTRSIDVSQGGTYEVTVTFPGECTASDDITIIGPEEASEIIILENVGVPNDGRLCSDGTVTLIAPPGSSYLWSFAGQTRRSLSFLFGQDATETQFYTFSVTVFDFLGCAGNDRTFSVDIIVDPILRSDIIITETSGVPNDGVICDDNPVVTLSSSEVATAYEWFEDVPGTDEDILLGSGASVNVSPNETTRYRLEVTNQAECVTADVITIFVGDCEAIVCTECDRPEAFNVIAGAARRLTQTSLPQDGITDACVNVSGNFIVDRSVTFTNCTFNMSPGATLAIDRNREIIFDNCTFRGCSGIWRGVFVRTGAKVTMVDSELMDAEYGLNMYGDNELSLRDNFFLNNYVSITQPSYANGDPVTFTALENNVFGCQEACFMLPPHDRQNIPPGDRPYAGVLLEAGAAFEFDGQMSNTFINMDNGFVSNGVDLVVRGVNFIRMVEYTYLAETDQPNGTAIFGRDCEISAAGNEMTDVSTGVISVDGTLTVRNNTMRDVRTGVYALRPADGPVIQNNPVIEFLRHGIYVRSPQTADPLTITNNRLETTGTFRDAKAIWLQAKRFNAVALGYDEVFNNSIELHDQADGIRLSQWRFAQLQDNDVLFRISKRPQYEWPAYGIILEGSDDNRTYGNQIVAETFSNQNIWAQYHFLSQRNSICCSYTENTLVGFIFSKNCRQTSFRGNEMVNHFQAFHLRPDTYIGEQPFANNFWTGDVNPANPGSWTANLLNTLGAAPAHAINLSAFDVAFSRFFITEDCTDAKWPAVILPSQSCPGQATDWFVTQKGGDDALCEQDKSCAGFFSIPHRESEEEDRVKTIVPTTSQLTTPPTGQLGVYPNPAGAELRVNLPGDETNRYELRLLSTTGRVVGALTAEGGATVTLPVAELPAGAYFLRVSGDDGSLSHHKVIVRR